MKFDNDHANWDGNDWGRVLFTDECHIWLDNQSQIWVQRPEYAAYLDQYMVHKSPSHDKISIWAGFSAAGVTRIHIIHGNLTGVKLVEIFADELSKYSTRVWGRSEWYLLQDNSPIHRYHEVEDWLAAKNIPKLDFPSYSPDLNPMENLWTWLKRQLDHHTYANVDELRIGLFDIWNNMPTDILFALVESMPKRLEAVRTQRGFKTKY